jgi:hypothetical protein
MLSVKVLFGSHLTAMQMPHAPVAEISDGHCGPPQVAVVLPLHVH